ncbi:VanZ family protein [Croceicoccus bisphenolivorans]|uniref:VanZ family protein n=1 Tax=Croceicoccus bisphenolivorans TaxID=1783232 RepID=UPI0008367E2C|nr:VanZ family protein [Croceicoccus bisphenolivorans]
MNGVRALGSLLAAACLCAILYFAIAYDGQLPDHPALHGKNDLALHAVSFALLTLTVHVARPGRCAALPCMVIAALIEIAQIWIPGREAAFDDFLAGAVGCVFVVLSFRLGNSILARGRTKTPPRALNEKPR